MIPSYEEHLFTHGSNLYTPKQTQPAISISKNKRSSLGERIKHQQFMNNGENERKDDGILPQRHVDNNNLPTWEKVKAEATHTIHVAYQDDQNRDPEQEAKNFLLYELEVRVIQPDEVAIIEKPMLPIRIENLQLLLGKPIKSDDDQIIVSTHISESVLGSLLLNACKAKDIQGAQILVQGIKSYTVLDNILKMQDSILDRTVLYFAFKKESFKPLANTIIEKLIELLYKACENGDANLNEQNIILEQLLSLGVGINKICTTLIELKNRSDERQKAEDQQYTEEGIAFIEHAIRNRADYEAFLGNDLLNACISMDPIVATQLAHEISSCSALNMQDTLGKTTLYYTNKNEILRPVTKIIIDKLVGSLHASLHDENMEAAENIVEILFSNRIGIDRICAILANNYAHDGILAIRALIRQKALSYVHDIFVKVSDPTVISHEKNIDMLNLEIIFRQFYTDKAAIEEISRYLITNTIALKYAVDFLRGGAYLIIEKIAEFIFEAFITENGDGLCNIIDNLLESKIEIRKVLLMLKKNVENQEAVNSLEQLVKERLMVHIHNAFDRFSSPDTPDEELGPIARGIRSLFSPIIDDAVAMEAISRHLLTLPLALYRTVNYLNFEAVPIIEKIADLIGVAFNKNDRDELENIVEKLITNRIEIRRIVLILSRHDVDRISIASIEKLMKEKFVLFLYETFKLGNQDSLEQTLNLMISDNVEIRFITETLQSHGHSQDEIIQVENLVKEKITQNIYNAFIQIKTDDNKIKKDIALSKLETALKQLYLYSVSTKEILVWIARLGCNDAELQHIRNYISHRYQSYAKKGIT